MAKTRNDGTRNRPSDGGGKKSTTRSDLTKGEPWVWVHTNRLYPHPAQRVPLGKMEPRVDLSGRRRVFIRWVTGEFEEVDEEDIGEPMYDEDEEEESPVESTGATRKSRRTRCTPLQGRIRTEQRIWADMGLERQATEEEEEEEDDEASEECPEEETAEHQDGTEYVQEEEEEEEEEETTVRYGTEYAQEEEEEEEITEQYGSEYEEEEEEEITEQFGSEYEEEEEEVVEEEETMELGGIEYEEEKEEEETAHPFDEDVHETEKEVEDGPAAEPDELESLGDPMEFDLPEDQTLTTEDDRREFSSVALSGGGLAQSCSCASPVVRDNTVPAAATATVSPSTPGNSTCAQDDASTNKKRTRCAQWQAIAGFRASSSKKPSTAGCLLRRPQRKRKIARKTVLTDEEGPPETAVAPSPQQHQPGRCDRGPDEQQPPTEEDCSSSVSSNVEHLDAEITQICGRFGDQQQQHKAPTAETCIAAVELAQTATAAAVSTTTEASTTADAAALVQPQQATTVPTADNAPTAETCIPAMEVAQTATTAVVSTTTTASTTADVAALVQPQQATTVPTADETCIAAVEPVQTATVAVVSTTTETSTTADAAALVQPQQATTEPTADNAPTAETCVAAMEVAQTETTAVVSTTTTADAAEVVQTHQNTVPTADKAPTAETCIAAMEVAQTATAAAASTTTAASTTADAVALVPTQQATVPTAGKAPTAESYIAPVELAQTATTAVVSTTTAASTTADAAALVPTQQATVPTADDKAAMTKRDWKKDSAMQAKPCRFIEVIMLDSDDSDDED